MDTAVDEEEFARWEELPPAVLAALLEHAPFKRADARLVCTAWRDAINSSLLRFKLPAVHLRVLRHLPAVRCLEVTMPDIPNPPADEQPGPNPWTGAATLERLTSLRLCNCIRTVEALASSLRTSQQRLLAAAGMQPPCSSGNGDNSGGDSSSSDDLSQLPRGLQELQQLIVEERWEQQTLQEVIERRCGAVSSSRMRDCGSTLAALLHTLPVGVAGCGGGGRLVPLPHLHTVRLSGRLSMDCSALAQLPALHTLCLQEDSDNPVPPDVSGCTGLTKLKLWQPWMLALPQLSALSHLQELDVGSCKRLMSLDSAGLASLTSLTMLNIYNCLGLWKDYRDPSGGHSSVAAAKPTRQDVHKLPALPHEQQLQLFPELASLTALRALLLHNNHEMRVLPASLSCLTQLQRLDASNCSLRFFDEHLLACTSLQELVLNGNVLNDLPDSISQLQQLQVLDVGNCESLWRLPDGLLRLSQLTRLVLTSMAIGQHIVEQLELRPVPVEVECTREDGFEEEFEDSEDWDDEDESFDEYWDDDEDRDFSDTGFMNIAYHQCRHGGF